MFQIFYIIKLLKHEILHLPLLVAINVNEETLML